MVSYEDVRTQIASIPVSPDDGTRILEWIGSSQIVGVARDIGGRVEILLRGPQLATLSKAVKDASDHRLIYREDGTAFEATRLVFPALAHFDQVAAFIIVELLRSGAESDLPRAFSRSEPIIELAIENLALANNALLGLAGELLMLDALSRRADDARVSSVISGWHGWRRSARDMVFGGTGIEVKTTTGSSSSHLVEGVHQVERDDDSGEHRLLLVSIGLQRAGNEDGNSFTVPSLVNRLMIRMADVGIPSVEIEHLQSRIAEYGVSSSIGYRHATDSNDPAYGVPFVTAFVRAYDMSDPAISVLRREDVAALRHVVEGSARFRVNLSVGGPISAGNPIEGAHRVARAILES